MTPAQLCRELNLRLHVVLPAAGIGRRMQADRPKQYLPLLDATLLEQTLRRFAVLLPEIRPVLVLAKGDHWYEDCRASLAHAPQVCQGGAERVDSVINALQFLSAQAEADDWVLVHDVARPCLRAGDLVALLSSLAQNPDGALLASPVADTLKCSDSDGCVARTVPRSSLWRALTPQVFRFKPLLTALLMHKDVTDESSAIEAAGGRPRLVEGSADNLKVTTVADLGPAAAVLSAILAEEQRV